MAGLDILLNFFFFPHEKELHTKDGNFNTNDINEEYCFSKMIGLDISQ